MTSLSSSDTEELRSLLGMCRSLGIDSVILAENRVRGCSATKKVAILSDLRFAERLPPIGIGRVTELDQRLRLFSDQVTVTTELGKTGDVSRLTMVSGRSKAQFRCSSLQNIKAPRANEDEPMLVLTLSATEIKQLITAVKTFGAATVLIRVDSAGAARAECVDSSNDGFSLSFERSAEFVDDSDAVLFTYAIAQLGVVLDAAVRGIDQTELVIGAAGSITVQIKGYSVLVMPNINDEED